MAKHNETGKIGEDIAVKWCGNNDLYVIERNYLKKYGEIDIVARQPATRLPGSGETSEIVHFIEVKTVSYETKQDLNRAVSHGTWRPEENVHKHKQLRLSRTIQAWVFEHKYDGKWQVDILAIRVVPREKYAVVNHIENVVFE